MFDQVTFLGDAAVPPFPVRRFSVAEYDRMIASNVLGENDAVELLSGWVVPKMPRGPRHDASLDQLHEALRESLPAGWRVRVQSAITTADSEPEPDLAVVPGPASRYAERHPMAQELALVVEVSDSSAHHDRTVKSKIYAEAGIPCYWLVDLANRRVEVYSQPVRDGGEYRYQSHVDYDPGENVPLTVEGISAAIGQGEFFAG